MASAQWREVKLKTGQRRDGRINSCERKALVDWRTVSLLSGAGRVVCSSLELVQIQPPNTAQLHGCPGSEQRQDGQDEEQFIFWI